MQPAASPGRPRFLLFIRAWIAVAQNGSPSRRYSPANSPRPAPGPPEWDSVVRAAQHYNFIYAFCRQPWAGLGSVVGQVAGLGLAVERLQIGWGLVVGQTWVGSRSVLRYNASLPAVWLLCICTGLRRWQAILQPAARPGIGSWCLHLVDLYSWLVYLDPVWTC